MQTNVNFVIFKIMCEKLDFDFKSSLYSKSSLKTNLGKVRIGLFEYRYIICKTKMYCKALFRLTIYSSMMQAEG